MGCIEATLALFGTLAMTWVAASKNGFHVAPMQTWTNFPLRQLYRGLAPLTLWTEMEKLADLKTIGDWNRRFPFQERDVVLQIGGNRPKEMKEVLSPVHAMEGGYNFHEVNLNCGCPSVKENAHFGASLMQQPALTKELLLAMREALPSTTNVSLKCRISAVDRFRDLEDGKGYDYNELYRYVETCMSSGCLSRLVLHCRPAVLQGLSPAKNRHVPTLKYEFARQLEQDFPGLEVVLNGGVRSHRDLRDLQEKGLIPSGGVMSGRWCLKEPLHACAAALSWMRGEEFTGIDKAVVVPALQHYTRFLGSREAEIFPNDQLVAPLFLVLQELEEMEEDIDEYIEVISEGIQEILLRSNRDAIQGISLVKTMYEIVGSKKVINKWKRNRAEL